MEVISHHDVRVHLPTKADRSLPSVLSNPSDRPFLHSGRISFKGSPSTVLGNLLNYVTVLPITLDIAIAAPALALPHGDQFDRIITATGKVHRLPLVIKDANVTDVSVVSALW